MILGISGKIGSGKDTVGQIIQYLTAQNEHKGGIELSFRGFKDYAFYNGDWQIKKFAYKLKQITALLLGVTVEQLEDREFKEKELGEEWWYWSVYDGIEYKPQYFPTREEAEKRCLEVWGDDFETFITLVKLTPRKILQLLGTEAGRNIIHPNIWVNSLFADYTCGDCNRLNCYDVEDTGQDICNFPNWIITDVRFPNEAKAIKDRGGIVIRVNRKMTSEEWQKLYPEVIVLDPDGWNRDERYQYEWFEEKITLEEYKLRVMRSTCKFKVKFEDYFKEHPSETALDNHKFDYVIDNSGSISDLIDKVKEILIKEEII